MLILVTGTQYAMLTSCNAFWQSGSSCPSLAACRENKLLTMLNEHHFKYCIKPLITK